MQHNYPNCLNTIPIWKLLYGLLSNLLILTPSLWLTCYGSSLRIEYIYLILLPSIAWPSGTNVKVRTIFSLHITPSFPSNPAFYPAWKFQMSFTAWSSTNLIRLHNLVSNNSLYTSSKLCETFGLPRTELFWYLQIKHFYTPFIRTGSPLNQMSQFECICQSDPHFRGLISLLYRHINITSNETLPSYTVKWSQDMDRTFDIEEWSNIWLATKTSSPNCFALEINFNVLARWYLVPARIAKFVPSYSGSCFRGCPTPGTHFHIWWLCLIAQEFWKKIFGMASKHLFFQTRQWLFWISNHRT